MGYQIDLGGQGVGPNLAVFVALQLRPVSDVCLVIYHQEYEGFVVETTSEVIVKTTKVLL